MPRVKSSKYFSEAELQCKQFPDESQGMDADFMEWLDTLREQMGEPIVLNSAERTSRHSAERHKADPTNGAHVLGCAVDVKIPNGAYRHKLIKLAFAMGVEGFGMEGGFVHLDKYSGKDGRPSVWVY